MSNVTPEQILAIGDALRAEPTNYVDMPTEWQDALTNAMRPDAVHGFTQQQAAWIYSWVLKVTPAQLTQLQALHPRQYVAREDIDGKRYLSAALLTDAMEGRRLAAAAPILTALTLYHIADLDWPAPTTEEEI